MKGQYKAVMDIRDMGNITSLLKYLQARCYCNKNAKHVALALGLDSKRGLDVGRNLLKKFEEK